MQAYLPMHDFERFPFRASMIYNPFFIRYIMSDNLLFTDWTFALGLLQSLGLSLLS